MKKNSVFIILGILTGLNLFAWVAVWDLGQARGLEVTFFDVGQGDAIFIETPQRYQIIIDGGPDDTVIEKLGKEMPFWDRSIDLVILTHPEHDHMAGLLEVLRRYDVKNILWTGVVRDTAEYAEWQKLIAEEGAQVYIAYQGPNPGLSPEQDKVTGNVPVTLAILYPFESLEGERVKNANNTSIILRLVFGDTSFLFTGDAPKSIERRLLDPVKQPELLDSDVLKVGHHGSKTSTAPEFVEAVSPEIAVISAGRDNKYGHPYPETLQNLEGIKILRTDINGDIKIISDGAEYEIIK